MKIIDWYILKKFLKSYVFVVCVIVSIVVIIDITEKNDNFIKHHLSVGDVAGYYLTFIPYIISMISPITVFITVVFITSQFAQHTELVALLSSGVSFQRIMRPYFYGAFIIAVASFFFAGWVIPNSNKKRVAFELQYFKSPYVNTDHDIHMKVGQDAYLYLYNYNNNADVGYKFTLETIDSNRVTARLEAPRMEWQDSTKKWRLKNWTLRKFEGMKEDYTTGSEMDTTLRITPKDFESDYNRFETLTMDELNNYIKQLKARGADNVIIYQVEKYIRIASPFAAFVLTFIGLTVSARKSRGGSGFQIALGFLLAFIYIIFYLFTRTSAETGAVNPIVTVWIPNFIFTAIGLVLYRTVPR